MAASKTRTSAARRGSGERDKVTIVLSNPLSAVHAVRLGAEDRDYAVDDEITVSRGYARSIIAAGYAQVDPEDRDAVAEALGVDTRQVPSQSTQSGPVEPS